MISEQPDFLHEIPWVRTPALPYFFMQWGERQVYVGLKAKLGDNYLYMDNELNLPMRNPINSGCQFG